MYMIVCTYMMYNAYIIICVYNAHTWHVQGSHTYVSQSCLVSLQYCNPSNCRITYSPSNILLQLAKYVNPKHWRHYSRIGTGHWRAAWSTWKVCYCCYGGMIPALLLLLRRCDTGCVTAVTGVWYRLCYCCYGGVIPVVTAVTGVWYRLC